MHLRTFRNSEVLQSARLSRTLCAAAFFLTVLAIGTIQPAEAESAFPYRISGQGYLTDDSHPWHPGDFFKAEIAYRLNVNPSLSEAIIEFESGPIEKREVDRYYSRRGRIFQAADDSLEMGAAPLGDLSAATVAALHPMMIEMAMQERPENLSNQADGTSLFAWNDELWRIARGASSGEIRSMSRKVYSSLVGDGEEVIAFEWSSGPGGKQEPKRVVVTERGRTIADIQFDSGQQAVAADSILHWPQVDRSRDLGAYMPESEIVFTQIAPHVYCIDLFSENTRVTVAEFADYVFVIEGAYTSRNCDMIAAKVREKFGKPVRYFAFSHLHGQYIGGTRSWVAEGAKVVVPPTTAPLVREIVNSNHSSHPDALSRAPREVNIEEVAESRTFKDATNELVVHNIVSQHTDEYLIFYFPQQKLLLCGDLMFYRPGKPITGRSKNLYDKVKALNLDVERYVATWPLDGYGTKSTVTKEEVVEAAK